MEHWQYLALLEMRPWNTTLGCLCEACIRLIPDRPSGSAILTCKFDRIWRSAGPITCFGLSPASLLFPASASCISLRSLLPTAAKGRATASIPNQRWTHRFLLSLSSVASSTPTLRDLLLISTCCYLRPLVSRVSAGLSLRTIMSWERAGRAGRPDRTS